MYEVPPVNTQCPASGAVVGYLEGKAWLDKKKLLGKMEIEVL